MYRDGTRRSIGWSRWTSSPKDITDFTAIHGEYGVELRTCLIDGRSERHRQRRHQLVSPTGCGLCGIERLAEAVRPTPQVISEVHLPEISIADALAALAKHQPLNHQTHATHAAAFYVPATTRWTSWLVLFPVER